MRRHVVTHLRGRIATPALADQILGDNACFKGRIHRLANGRTLRLEPQVFEQHRRRENRRHRIGDVSPRSLRVGAVDRFEQSHLGPDTRRGQHAERAADDTRLVGQDVPEHVLGDHHVELAGVPDEALAALAKKIKNFALPVTGVSGFESAQVTAGGVQTAEFRADTLESRLAPGVFACGEVLDIDGDCGGYNLQWAWSSGYVAGMLGKQEEPR